MEIKYLGQLYFLNSNYLCLLSSAISHKYIPISHNSSISHSAILVSHQAINRAVNYLFQPSAYNFSRPVYLPSPINSSPKLLNYSFFNSCSSHNSYLSVLQLSPFLPTVIFHLFLLAPLHLFQLLFRIPFPNTYISATPSPSLSTIQFIFHRGQQDHCAVSL